MSARLQRIQKRPADDARPPCGPLPGSQRQSTGLLAIEIRNVPAERRGAFEPPGWTSETAFAVEQKRSDRAIVADGISDKVNLLLSNVKTRDTPPRIVAGIERVSRRS